MTVKLYWQDAYMKEFDSKVEKVEGNKVVLRETAFYPTGGGVLNDTGTLSVNGMGYKVVDVSKEGETIFHHLEVIPQIVTGVDAHGTIDWERRYALMRYHTAVHLLDGIVETKYQAGGITGGQIFPERARIDFGMDQLNRELLQKIVDEANAVAREGHRVSARIITREEALAMPNLARTEPGKELIRSMPEVRIVNIEGVDVQSDGGLHVANTKEIGTIKFSKYENKGKNSKRVEITL
jgi:misacylated tRNA(Ala) deacylase